MTYTAEQKLTQAELEQGRLHLDRALISVVEATDGLSEEQWTFKPAPDSWSIAETVEHIAIVQELILGPIAHMLAESPETVNPDAEQIDAILINQSLDRSVKFRGPEPVMPSGQWGPSTCLERIRHNHGRLIDYLESARGLRLHLLEAAPIKAMSKGQYTTMDGYEWLLAAALHTERHALQMLEVKADPNYPAQ
jgi:hypothetical protein